MNIHFIFIDWLSKVKNDRTLRGSDRQSVPFWKGDKIYPVLLWYVPTPVSSQYYVSSLILFTLTPFVIGWRAVETCIFLMGLSLIRVVRSVQNKTKGERKKEEITLILPLPM